MADVTIDANVGTTHHGRGLRGGPFWKSPTVGYIIYLDANFDLIYNKTANGGATWGGPTELVAAGSCDCLRYDCYADWQTDGDAGTKIHVVYMSLDTEEIRYVYLDTSDDSAGGGDLIETCQGSGTFNTNYTPRVALASITKTRGGNFAVFFKYDDSVASGFDGFYTSPDADTWTSKTSPLEADEDYCLLFPANLADNDDIWGVYWDIDAGEISLKTFDDSNNDWTTIAEASISGSMVESTSRIQMNGDTRLSDGHLLLAAWSEYDSATADLKCWDITDAGTITAKTNIKTDAAEHAYVAVFINQDNDDWYVTYLGGTALLSEVAVFYQKSTDGGGNWATLGELAMQANAEDDERWPSSGAVKAANGGKFLPIWMNDDDNDLFTNTDNGISIAAAGGVTHEGAATLSGVGTLACIGVGIFIGKATVAGTGTLVANGVITAIGKATLSGVGTLAAVAHKALRGAATLSGVGTLAANGVITAIGKATLSGVGTLVASGHIVSLLRLTIALYNRALTAKLYNRALTAKLHNRAVTTKLHGRTLTAKLHNRAITLKKRTV